MDPVKVILPAWRRGDGKPCKQEGWYATRWHSTKGRVSGCMFMCAEHELEKHLDYAGPIEFIETEPEPLTLPGCQPPIVFASGAGFACAAYDNNSHARALFVGKTRREAIVAYNAAVEAMEWK